MPRPGAPHRISRHAAKAHRHGRKQAAPKCPSDARRRQKCMSAVIASPLSRLADMAADTHSRAHRPRLQTNSASQQSTSNPQEPKDRVAPFPLVARTTCPAQNTTYSGSTSCGRTLHSALCLLQRVGGSTPHSPPGEQTLRLCLLQPPLWNSD